MSKIFTRTFRVRWSETNANGQVGIRSLDIVDNTVYAAHAEEAAARTLAAVGWSPADLKARGLAVATRRIHLQYQSPAVWGDRLQVITYLLGLDDTGGDWYVAVQRPADGVGIVKCILS